MTYKGAVIFLLVFISFILMSNIGLCQNNTKEYKFTEKKIEEIESYIYNQMKLGKIPGMCAVIVEGNNIILNKGFGFSDVDKKAMVSSDTLFELGSNSKAFTALGILKLQKDGLISLDNSVRKYIPWLTFKYNHSECDVSIEQLLHQTSGIPFNTIAGIPPGEEEDTLEKTIRNLIGLELRSTPGSVFHYATINYDILGLVIQNVSGQSYESYMKENILNPLDLNNTYLFKKDIAIDNMSKGYKVGFLKNLEYNPPVYRGNTPAGYYISNGKDMSKWLMMQLGTYETDLYKTLIDMTHVPNESVPYTEAGGAYGFGWFISQKEKLEYSHSGSNPNYSSFIVLRPEENIGVAVLANINSSYTQVIGKGIIDVINGKTPKKIASDTNIKMDTILSIIFAIIFILIIVFIVLIIKSINQIKRKQRIFKCGYLKGIVGVFLYLTLLCITGYFLNKIPDLLLGKLTWEFIVIWTPNSFIATICLFYILVIFLLSYVMVNIIFPKAKINNFKLKY